jgi:ribonuclease HI
MQNELPESQPERPISNPFIFQNAISFLCSSVMAQAKPKWYVVLKGRTPGIYTRWDEAKAQIFEFTGAVYKGFESKKEADEAWAKKRFPQTGSSSPAATNSSGKSKQPQGPFIVVDASSLGVPGPTEYQGFLMPEKRKLFGVEIGLATNNIGEFLAIVHALAYLYKHESNLPIYSDSVTALSWVQKKKVKSELVRDQRTEEAWQLVDRALVWLNTHQVANRIWKWETEHWGENPADYGRK